MAKMSNDNEDDIDEFKKAHPIPHQTSSSILYHLWYFLNCEVDIIYFDWLSMMCTCSDLGTRIANAFSDDKPAVFVEVVCQLLYDAWMAEELSKTSGSSDDILLSGLRCLEEAHKMIQEVIIRPVQHHEKRYIKRKVVEGVVFGGDKELALLATMYGLHRPGVFQQDVEDLEKKLFANWAKSDLERDLVLGLAKWAKQKE